MLCLARGGGVEIFFVLHKISRRSLLCRWLHWSWWKIFKLLPWQKYLNIFFSGFKTDYGASTYVYLASFIFAYYANLVSNELLLFFSRFLLRLGSTTWTIGNCWTWFRFWRTLVKLKVCTPCCSRPRTPTSRAASCHFQSQWRHHTRRQTRRPPSRPWRPRWTRRRRRWTTRRRTTTRDFVSFETRFFSRFNKNHFFIKTKFFLPVMCPLLESIL